ncbi:MAG: proline racemase family protein [Akkermansiaceae bacterium]|nr:proline racemase family protein [Akkermansiaceae bacterium]
MQEAPSTSVKVIDSHTIGEPTRVIFSGGPELGTGPLSDRAAKFSAEHEDFRRAVCLEPRGHDGVVGALLVEPHAADCDAGIIFFNNRDTLGMCIHGTIGLVATLRYLGRLNGSSCRIDTPVGPVTAEVDPQGRVSVTNVPCFRTHHGVSVELTDHGTITGDVAWGGNWFFLVDGQGPTIDSTNIHELTHFCESVREALIEAGVTAFDGHEIDHIELFGPPTDSNTADSRNFVLCPGGAYDRSPCGTGLSAKLACLAADGKLQPGQIWRQASILNQNFEASYRQLEGEKILPTVTGKAWITGEATFLFDPEDPFQFGV